MKKDRAAPISRSAAALAALAIIAIASVGALFHWNQTRPEPFESELPIVAGYNYQLILVGRSTCSACRDPALPEAVAQVRDEIAFEAMLASEPVTSMAIITDPDHGVGAEFSKRFGRFDEIALGGGWDNSALRSLEQRSESAILATPALYLLRRTMLYRESGTGLIFGPDTVLQSIIGAESIKGFAQGLASLKPVPSENIVGVSVPIDPAGATPVPQR